MSDYKERANSLREHADLKECQYITEDEVWERFVIVRRIWMKYNGREPQEV